jgi:acyl carrier protein
VTEILGRARTGVEHVPARNPYEDAIVGIWRDVLRRSDIGVLDNFFDVDGHSLLAVKVVARIRKMFGVDVPVRDLFDSPTVAALAAAVAARSAAPSAARPEVTPRPPDAEPVLSYDQHRLWLEHQLRAATAYNVHGRHRLRGALDVAALERSIAVIVRRHEALRTRFPLVEGAPVQVVDDADEHWRIAFEDVSGSDGRRDEAATRLADEHATTAFDLQTGPLLRCLLIRLGDDDHLLAVTMHHIVSDAWSVGLFLRELSALYEVGGDETAADLPHLPIQYRDYAAWQRGWLAGDVLEGLLDHWRGQLAGAPPALALPTSRARAVSQGAVGGRVWAEVSAEETAALHELCRSHGVTAFMALLAAFAVVLQRRSGQDDLVVGAPITTRNDAGTGQLVGLFLNTLPLRVDLSGDPTFAELLARVRRVALDGYAHGEAPFDLLVKDLEPPRDPTRTPLFQAVLNMIDVPDGHAAITDLSVEELPVPVLPSKCDLMLNAREDAGAFRFNLAFHADRYDAGLMQSLLDQFCALLRRVTADAANPVSAYALDAGAPATTTAAVDVAGPAGGWAAWATEGFDLTGDDRFALLGGSPQHAAVAAATARAAGVSLTVPDDATTGEIGALAAWLGANAISVLYLAAPMLRALATQEPAQGLPMLRQVFVDNAGDLTAQDVALLRAMSPSCGCAGLYHATSAAGPIAAFAVPEAWSVATAPLRVPLGTAIEGSGLELLRAGQPAAVGEVGEIHVAGTPSGDLARRWPDGTLEFVGRTGADATPPEPYADLVETVTALRDLLGVADAVVTAFADPDDGPALTAHVATANPDVSTTDLRTQLVTRLPEYLVPAYIVLVDRLPLTADGRYDLDALPGPGLQSALEDAYVAPRTPMERELTATFESLLDVERVGVHDTFFELNGFSLLATQLATRIRETFQVELPLGDVFAWPTVEGLARLIVQKQVELADGEALQTLLDEIE